MSGRPIKRTLRGQRVALRGDADVATPEIYEELETRGVQYAIRMPAKQEPGARNRRPPVSFAGTAEPRAVGPVQGFLVSG